MQFKNYLILYFIAIGFYVNIFPSNLYGQRVYTSSSVLSTGDWYKISVQKSGMYKVDVGMLTSLGINTNNLNSNSIRLFGNGGEMLPESNQVLRIDDLYENPLQIFDGGDGIFNGNDYFIFYSKGIENWLNDSIQKSFKHQINLYSNECFYFITIGGIGKRILNQSTTLLPNKLVNSFNERIYHEIDSINFLYSGKQWYGEEFNNNLGGISNRTFTYTLNGLILTEPLTLKTAFASRSIGASNQMNIGFNNVQLPTITIPAISGNYLDAFAVDVTNQFQTFPTSNIININFQFQAGVVNGQLWLNWFEVFGRRLLTMQSVDQLLFRDWNSVGLNNISQFNISNSTTSTQVWDVTNALEPIKMNVQFANNVTSFTNNSYRLNEYISFTGNQYFVPKTYSKIDNQNIHANNSYDYLIITHKSLKDEAQRLAQFHVSKNNLKVLVVTTEQIFNEFSSGLPDPTAIKDFIKMFYDRAQGNAMLQPKYVCLFGDGSFDYKDRIQHNNNLVPTYQSINSIEPLQTYTSDDYFGLLDDFDDVNLTSPPSLLDVGIGRIPVKNIAEAKIMVDKIINYYKESSYGSWRNQITFVADDEDANIHLNDAEFISSNSSNQNPLLNINKIYLDAHVQQSGNGGSRYPSVNQSIINQMFQGNLIWNYTGHGGSKRLAEEAVFDQDVLNQINNSSKLPLFITATCDFAPYDNPTVSSIGENVLLNNDKGAIALLTTTRIVFSFSNRIINNNYLQFALKPNTNGTYLTLGESLKLAKNYTYNTFGDFINNRKFTLLGDPAMTLGFPEFKIQVNSINNAIPTGNDTLQPLKKYKISGEILNHFGQKINMTGTLFPTVFDKAQTLQTLSNDPGSLITNFNQQLNVLYKGKASVTNGDFSFEFIVPKDISPQAGKGKISLYANDAFKDASGVFNNIYIGGTASNVLNDNAGPTIKAFLNNDKFVNGGLVNENSILIVKLFDSSGINLLNNSIGHDIVAKLDGNDKNIMVLNDYYEADLNSFQSGTIQFPLPLLEEGHHYLTIKAWDAVNNSSEITIDFIVSKSETLKISKVYNYPNPFTTSTAFWFEHNQPMENLNALIQIFTVSGKLIHQIQKNILPGGNRVCDIFWDGKDSYSEKVAKGVYIYRIIVFRLNGQKAESTQKLYIL